MRAHSLFYQNIWYENKIYTVYLSRTPFNECFCTETYSERKGGGQFRLSVGDGERAR